MGETSFSQELCQQIARSLNDSHIEMILTDSTIAEELVGDVVTVSVYQNGFDFIKHNAKAIIHNCEKLSLSEGISHYEGLSFEEQQEVMIRMICEHASLGEKAFSELWKCNRLLVTFFDVPYQCFINDNILVGIRFKDDKNKMMYVSQFANVNTKTELQCFFVNVLEDVKEYTTLPYSRIANVHLSKEALEGFLQIHH